MYSKVKYGGELCPGNGNGRACKALGTERAKMSPYMRELEKMVGYKSIKAKFSHMGNMEEFYVDSEETELSFNTVYKSPILEKDEKIQALEKEKENLSVEKEKLQENLTKAESKLTAVEKVVKLKTKQLSQATAFTERRLAEMISLGHSSLEGNPDLIPLLAILQERDNLNVDRERDEITPVHEENFLGETLKTVFDKSSRNPEIQFDQCKERLGSVKNQLLDSVKQRWIKQGSGRRHSIGSSIMSGGSKRDREDQSQDRNNRQRTTSPLENGGK